MTVDELPHATAKSLRILGKIRQGPEDFRVEELPAYPPEGSGEHLFVHFEKVGLNTQEAVRRIAVALEVDPAQAGWAGLKDRVAITRQWASFQGADATAARALQLPQIRILDAIPHGHKLRTGHLRGNRFVLRIRGAGPHEAIARELLGQLDRLGVPNYFGEQRFGTEGQNLERARSWLLQGGRPPRDRFQRKLQVSTLQSAAFNEWLAARMREPGTGAALEGDLMRKEDTGGMFVAEAPAEAQPRLERWEISPTGPIFGPKMRWPGGEAAERERAVLERWGGEALLGRLGRLGQGTRRVARLRPVEPDLQRQDDDLTIAFTLPRGAYATVVLRELLKPGETSIP